MQYLVNLIMRKFAVLFFIFMVCNSTYAQESGLVVRYEFTGKPSPPMVPFYLRIYINDILMDSTKPHMPHHNLANAVRIPLEKGSYKLKIEGITTPKEGNSVSVMEWVTKLEITRVKSRVHLKLNDRYEIRSTMVNY